MTDKLVKEPLCLKAKAALGHCVLSGKCQLEGSDICLFSLAKIKCHTVCKVAVKAYISWCSKAVQVNTRDILPDEPDLLPVLTLRARPSIVCVRVTLRHDCAVWTSHEQSCARADTLFTAPARYQYGTDTSRQAQADQSS